MSWIEKATKVLDRASDTLQDVQESGLAENAGKMLQSVSQVMERYASNKKKDESDRGD